MECKECYQSGLVEELSKRVEKLEAEVSDLKVGTGKNDEQIKMIFKILNEIKESLDKIGNKLETIQEKPAKRWDDLIRILMSAGVGGLAGHFLK